MNYSGWGIDDEMAWHSAVCCMALALGKLYSERKLWREALEAAEVASQAMLKM